MINQIMMGASGEALPLIPINDFSLVGDALTYALMFFYRGVKIAPCQPKSKAFIGGFGPYLKHIETDIELHSWLLERGANYALLTGFGGLVVIDFDDLNLYNRWHDEVGHLAETFTVRTRRGRHVYYFCQDVRSWNGVGFEVMGRNGAIMGPMSIHPTGVKYTPLYRPIIREIRSISDFPLLSESRPELPEPPKVRPNNLGGGVIAKIKRDYLLVDLIQSDTELAHRVKLKTSDRGKGRWFAGYCPFHDDKRKKSFWVDAQRNLYGCHSCGARGDIINFVARSNGWSVKEAIKRMARGEF